MYTAEFEYFRPKTVREAFELMAAHPGASVLAGGHSLLPAMKLRLARPPALIDIGRLSELRGLQVEDGALRIGALTTYAELLDSAELHARCPIVTEAAAQIGDVQVRNRGTVGGSLAHADPGADLPTVMVALGATIYTEHQAGAANEYAARSFFMSLFTTALQERELITAVRVPLLAPGTGSAYLKHKHPASGYAVVGVAAIVSMDGERCTSASLAIGGVTPNPVYVTAAEALAGQVPGDDAIAAVVAQVAGVLADPLGDHYASGAYRQHLATVMARRALQQAVQRASERAAA